MSKNTARHKTLSFRFKLALGIFMVFLTLIFSSLIYYARKIEPLVAERIKETIENSTDSLYSISFSEIRINAITGNVRLKNIRFKAHDDVYQKQKKQGFNPTHLYDISVKSLVLKKAHPIKAFFNKDLEIKELIIDHPVIRVFYQHPRKETTEAPDKRTAWQRLKKYLNSVKVKEISLNNIDFQYIDESLAKPEIDGVKNLSVKIKDLLIDSLSHLDKSRFYFTKDISVQVRDHEYLTRDNKYKVFLNEINFSS
jgi:hypothetical protein